jgi:hypothetical protein
MDVRDEFFIKEEDTQYLVKKTLDHYVDESNKFLAMIHKQ